MITQIKVWYSDHNKSFHVYIRAEEDIQIENISTKLLDCLTMAMLSDDRFKFRPFVVEGTVGWVAERNE